MGYIALTHIFLHIFLTVFFNAIGITCYRVPSEQKSERWFTVRSLILFIECCDESVVDWLHQLSTRDLVS